MQIEYKELYNIVEGFYAEGKFQEALNVCLEITNRNPSEFDANFYASVIFFILNNFESSSRFALNAFKIRPQNKANIIMLVKSLTQISLFEQASLFIENYPGKFPDTQEIDTVFEEIKINPFKYEKKSIPLHRFNDKNSLNILFIQDAPCIRNYKYAAALKKRGHKVTLAYFIKKLSERYQGLNDDVYEDSIKITGYKQLWELSKNFDLIHSHNEPDYYTIAAMAGSIPVIHDTHDLISLREPENNQLKYFEGVANRGAAGRIYSTPYQYKEAQDLYGVNGNSIVFYNYAAGDHLPKNYLPKLSSIDGKIHLVYEGGVSGSDGKHRDFADQFVKLSQLGYFVHIYPAAFNEELNSFFSLYPNIVYNNPIPPGTLIEIMTQFDFGIIPWNIEKGNVRFLSSTIANKLFEYLAAGIPVAAADITSYRDFFKKNHVGITFSSIEDFHSKIDTLQKIKNEMTGKKIEFTYESEIEKVEKFYFEIIGKKKSGGEVTSTPESNYTSTKSNIETAVSSSFEKLQSWIDSNGWAGYDPYDIEDFIMSAKSKGKLSDHDEQKIRHFNEIEPLLCRQELKIEKKINAKALGLLLSSYSILYSVLNDNKYLVKAEEIAQWLLKNRSGGYKNMCWGYPFDWQSKIFIPKGTPSVVASTVVGDGFWQLYNVTRNELYLDICVSICEFITDDLNCDSIDEERVCFSYTPFDNFHVHNANLFAGEFLARIGREISASGWVEKGIKTANYALSEQNTDGSIFYWSHSQDSNNPKHLDSYHSGFEIRSLYNIYYHTGIEKIKAAADKYLHFYLNTYIQSDGSTLQFPPGEKNSQVNIHGAAETILLLSSLVKEKKELKDCLETCLTWTINNLQQNEGWFGYLIKENKKLMIPFIRWGEAWMMRAMSEYLLKEENKVFNKKKIFKNKNKKPKICHIGGAHSIHVSDIVCALDKLGYEQTIISYMQNERSITPSHIKVYCYPYRDYINNPSLDKEKFELELKYFLERVYAIEKPDIIHGHSLTYSAAALWISKNIFKIPCAVTPWSTYSIKQPNVIVNYYEEKCLSVLDYFLYGMKSISKMFSDFYNNVGNYKYKEFRTLLPLELYSKKREVVKKPKILSIRVMTELYKQELLVKSIPDLCKLFPDLKVTFLIGQDPVQGKEYFQKMMELAENIGILEHCTFINRSLSQKELADLVYEHNIVFAVSSHDEGYSASATMAMLSGAITIVQDTIETKDELIHKKNLLKVDLTVESVYENLMYAIENIIELQNLFIKENKFLLKFSKDKMINNLLSAYNEMYLLNERV